MKRFFLVLEVEKVQQSCVGNFNLIYSEPRARVRIGNVAFCAGLL